MNILKINRFIPIPAHKKLTWARLLPPIASSEKLFSRQPLLIRPKRGRQAFPITPALFRIAALHYRGLRYRFGSVYINTRIAVLTNVESEETTRFRRLYGDQYWQNIVRWFQQAQQEVAAA